MKQKLITLFVLFLASFGSYAQAPGCDPCGPWPNPPLPGSTTFLSFTFSLPYRPGCTYKAYVAYETRVCMGMTEVKMLSYPLFEEFAPGPACDLHSTPDCPNLLQIVMNQIMLTTGPILKADPSPCYYLGTIVVPPGAEVCYGMTPGSKRYVMVPCDTNGCCFAQITPGPPGSTYFYQHVISSTSCPPAPLIPPSETIVWSCDILGGGSTSFIVPFTPDSPLVCQMTCYEGWGSPAAKPGAIANVNNNIISDYKVYPNPVTDELNISFNADKDNEIVVAELYNMQGQKVSSTNIKTAIGKQTVTINTHSLIPGMYTCKFKYGQNIIITKVTK